MNFVSNLLRVPSWPEAGLAAAVLPSVGSSVGSPTPGGRAEGL